MYISVDASTVSVEDAGDFKAFHVQVPQGWAAERIGAELTGSGAGRLGPDGPEIWPDWVISTVAGDRQWCTEFTAMVAYAKTKGWVTEDSTIKAHIEYR
jgi:hypothetical protein